MKNSRQFNGDRLKAARTYRGHTVVELADIVGLQRQTVSTYENNTDKNIDISSLLKISNALKFPPEFFLQNDHMGIKRGSTYFRSLLTTTKKYRNQQILKMDFLSTIYTFLNEYVDFPPFHFPNLNGDFTIEEAAQNLRSFWNLGDSPIENIVYLVEQNGILVSQFDTDTDDIDAFSQMLTLDNETVYLIAYSKNRSTAARIHFDIAHELGHMLLHEWSEDIETLSKEDFKERENEAHSFASAFLLPREPFIKDVGSYANKLDYYTVLKKKWRVSISAMIRRSYNLGLINYSQYQLMNREMQKRGIKKFEPLDDQLFTAKPSLLKASVHMLLDKNVFTPKTFLDQLSADYQFAIYSKEIEDILDLPAGTLKITNDTPVHVLNIKENRSEN